MNVPKVDISELDISFDIFDFLGALFNRGRGEHDVVDFVDIDQKLVEVSVHGAQEEERT